MQEGCLHVMIYSPSAGKKAPAAKLAAASNHSRCAVSAFGRQRHRGPPRPPTPLDG